MVFRLIKVFVFSLIKILGYKKHLNQQPKPTTKPILIRWTCVALVPGMTEALRIICLAQNCRYGKLARMELASASAAQSTLHSVLMLQLHQLFRRSRQPTQEKCLCRVHFVDVWEV